MAVSVKAAATALTWRSHARGHGKLHVVSHASPQMPGSNKKPSEEVNVSVDTEEEASVKVDKRTLNGRPVKAPMIILM